MATSSVSSLSSKQPAVFPYWPSIALPTLDSGTRAFSNYVRQANKKLAELKIEQAKYEKRDISKVIHKEAVCLEEMATIRRLVEFEIMRA